MSNEKLYQSYKKNIRRLNEQRTRWIQFSFLGVLSIFGLSIFWTDLSELQSDFLWIAVITSVSIITVTWWFWALKLIRQIINYQHTEFDLIFGIQEDLKALKKEIIKLKNDNSNS